MQMAGENLLIILVVGLIAGWLAGQMVQGAGFGIVGELLMGVAGAFIGRWLLPQLGSPRLGHYLGNYQRQSFGGSLEGRAFLEGRHGNVELSSALPTRSRVGVA